MEPLALFRLLAPEFAGKPDSEVNMMMEIAKPHVSASQFGSFYPHALVFYTAHRFAMLGVVAVNGSAGPAATGELISEKEGDLQRTYAQRQENKRPDQLEKTYYGQEYLALARSCIVPVLCRQGGDVLE